ncbi:MAG TPA: hypothetical protein PKH02_04655 [Bacteroidales bacterium]|nr:hypothetical protein [Bacteroidales bacterium]HPT11569.1 hypothetical protein [Bacteroidales bacterium]
MKTNKLTILISALLLISPALAYSQEYSVNPYSIFGVGDVNMTDGGRLAGMGGSGISLRNGRVLNTLNPAALSALDSTTFIFDVSGSGKGSRFTSGSVVQTNFNANFTKIALGWRMTPKWVVGAFVQPYSTVSYKVKTTSDMGGGYTTTTTYIGNGGLNRFCITNSFNLTKSLSAGFNTTFIFGGIERSSEQVYLVKENSRTSKITFDFGLQYHKPIGAYELGFGLVGGYRNVLTWKNTRQVYDNSYSLVEEYNKYSTQITIPEYYGGGIALSKGSSFMASLDYRFQRWSLTTDHTYGMTFVDTHKLLGGVAFIPNEQHATSYFGIIQYQAGFSVGNSYLNINEHKTTDYELFFGGSFPFRGGTLMNVALSYGKKGSNSFELIREDYVRATFTFSILERWFIKRLYD